MHQTLIQWQNFPCQKTRIVQADGLLHPLWVLFYANLKRGTLIAICVAEWGQTVWGPREGGCRGNALWLPWEWQLPHHPVYLCYKSATIGATKRGSSFQMLRQCQTYSLRVPISIFTSQLLVCRASTFIFCWAQKLLKPSLKSGAINKHVTEIKLLRTNIVETNSSRILSPELLST